SLPPCPPSRRWNVPRAGLGKHPPEGHREIGLWAFVFFTFRTLEYFMEHLLSSRPRAADVLRRGRYLPRLDVLEDRLPPGDMTLARPLGLSPLGSGLDVPGPQTPVARGVVTAETRLLPSDETADTGGMMPGLEFLTAADEPYAAELPGETVVVSA